MGKHGAIVGGPDFEFARGSGRKQIAMACVVPEGVDGTQEGNAKLIASAPCMRRIGAQLSNVAFNLAQRVGQPLSTHDAEILDRLRREWDAAIRAA
jgi:hypothetical protein